MHYLHDNVTLQLMFTKKLHQLTQTQSLPHRYKPTQLINSIKLLHSPQNRMPKSKIIFRNINLESAQSIVIVWLREFVLRSFLSILT